MIRLTTKQIDQMSQYFNDYINAENAATGSKLNSNANVSNKNIATAEVSMDESFHIQLNRRLISDKIRDLFDAELAKQYNKDLEDHLIYTHDESSLKPYCVSISLYPFILDGLKKLGGESVAPKNIHSFCGSFINLMFLIASQFAGAVATPEFLMYFDYFARLEWGNDYLYEKQREVHQLFQQVVYSLNQPAAARGNQSVFWNISTYDEGFFNGLFSEFVFPDTTKPDWASVKALQREWHEWFRKERTKTILTFPVVTHAALVTSDDWVDTESREFIAEEMAKGGEFFIYTSDSADSLSSCCRLRNELADNTFSYSLGAGGIMSGSKNVITINVNRLVQGGHKLKEVVSRVHKYQVAFNEHFKHLYDNGMLDAYSANFISLDKQFLTIGLNGVVEAAESLGFKIDPNKRYKKWLKCLFGQIKGMNKRASKEHGVRFNTEIVPAEGLGTKNPMWDRKDGLKVNRDTYNSYLYRVEDDNLSVFDKMELHGGDIVKSLDGGSALHFNNDERLTRKQYRVILQSLASFGCNYFCENVKKTCCKDCGAIHANTLNYCIECGSRSVEYAVRIIGYLKKIKNFSAKRKLEEGARSYSGI